MKRKDSAQSGNKTVKSKEQTGSKMMGSAAQQKLGGGKDMGGQTVGGYKNLTFKGKIIGGSKGGNSNKNVDSYINMSQKESVVFSQREADL